MVAEAVGQAEGQHDGVVAGQESADRRLGIAAGGEVELVGLLLELRDARECRPPPAGRAGPSSAGWRDSRRDRSPRPAAAARRRRGRRRPRRGRNPRR